MVNLTITVDPETLRRARVRALSRHESVNSYLAEALRRYADEPPTREVFAELAGLADAHRAGSEGRGTTWRRDDLHRG